MDAIALAKLFERLPELAHADDNLIRRGMWCEARFAVGIGDVPFYVTIARGRIAAFERGPALMRAWQFSVKATASAWEAHWQAVPAPDSYDLLALMKREAASVEGDLKLFFAHLQYFKDLLAKPRALAAGGH